MAAPRAGDSENGTVTFFHLGPDIAISTDDLVLLQSFYFRIRQAEDVLKNVIIMLSQITGGASSWPDLPVPAAPL